MTDLHSGMRAYRKTLIDELKYNARGAALPVDAGVARVLSARDRALAFAAIACRDDG